MDKISYELTLDDCNKFSKSLFYIPRLKKQILNTNIKTCIGFIKILIIIYSALFCWAISQICTKYNLSLTSVINDKQFPLFLFSQFKFYSLAIIIFSLIFFVMLYVKTYFWGGKSTYRMLSGCDLNYELSISEDNITRTSKDQILTIKWNSIKDIYDTKYNYLIFISNLQALIIPKRCFDNDEQSKEFYNKMKTYYNEIMLVNK